MCTRRINSMQLAVCIFIQRHRRTFVAHNFGFIVCQINQFIQLFPGEYAEKSWDCPCHGSRFSCDGEMLTGPARKDLEVISLAQLVEEHADKK